LALNDSDPALQLRATESLQAATGENLGSDIRAWQEYVRKSAAPDGTRDQTQTAEEQQGKSSIMR
jgi:hypothetical protein